MKHYIYSERADLFEPNIYIQFLVQISGDFSPDDLISAVKTAFKANEVTMSRIVLEKTGTAYYEKMNESGCKVVFSQKEWIELIRENEKIPFDINKGELIRVFVISSNGKISLLIIAHHLAGDGKSITYFLEDVMKVLSGENLEYKPLYLITKNFFPKESKLPIYLKLYVNSFNRKWQRSGRSFTWDDYYNIHETYWKERSSQVIYETFSREEIDRIRICAKEMGVTVNTYIITAFLKANTDNSTIGIAVDARTDDNRSMSNQATGISVENRYSKNISFAENAKLIHQKINKKLKNPVKRYFILQFIALFTPTLIDSILLHTYDLYQSKISQKLAKVMGYKDGKKRDIGITNLTRLNIPDKYGSYKITDILFIPPVVSYAKHIIGASTTEQGMMISYHYMSNQDEEEERKFFKRAVKNIKITNI